MNALNHSSARYRATAPSAMSRSYVVYSGKGGVGRTTIAYNLAVSFGQMSGVRVVLIDGDMQFSDLRGLLRVPDTAPSILQLPTDRIAESDLASVLWRDPSGIDLLLAPPRVEQAEMVTSRDVEKVISLLRRIYNVIVIDSPPAINDTTLAYLDDADSILSIVTPDRNSVRNARLAGQAFVAAGMAPHKMMLIMNRAGSPGIKPEQMAAELGRLPDIAIPDDGPLVKGTTAEGVPFVLAQPKSKASQQIMDLAQRLTAPPDPAPARPAPVLAKSLT
jgi:pilus assembly protein CpaE